MSVEVSVIVALYNPDLERLRGTLESILKQKDIAFEVILCDDGSQARYKYKKEIGEIFQRAEFYRFRCLERERNGGTVKNCLMGIEAAQGEYVYSISPGDFLYDEYVLRNLYRFAKSENADFCFGKARFYSCENGQARLHKSTYPKLASVYRYGGKSQVLTACSFLYGNQVIGTAYFRKTQLYLRYMRLIEDKVIYTEDTPTTALYLLDHHKLCYYNQYVVWYEYGVGISTQASGKWSERLKKDAEASKQILLEEHPDSRLVKARYHKQLRYLPIYGMEAVLKLLEKIHGLAETGRNPIDLKAASYLEALLGLENR